MEMIIVQHSVIEFMRSILDTTQGGTVYTGN
jgi:mRNA degradation ribonuclease J1/J2